MVSDSGAAGGVVLELGGGRSPGILGVACWGEDIVVGKVASVLSQSG